MTMICRQATLSVFVLVSALPLQGWSMIDLPPGDSDQQDAVLKLSHLQSELENLQEHVRAKNHYLLKCDETIKQLDAEIERLCHIISAAKNEASADDHRVMALNEEKRILRESLKKTNSDLRVLESKAHEAEDEIIDLEDRLEKMEDIVAEQWIQVRQFQQALEDTQRSLEEARNEHPTFLSSIMKMMDYLIANLTSAAKLYAFEALSYTDALYSLARTQHHEFQRGIKERMRSNSVTSSFASNEVVFWVTSAIIVFPVVGSLIFLSSQFG